MSRRVIRWLWWSQVAWVAAIGFPQPARAQAWASCRIEDFPPPIAASATRPLQSRTLVSGQTTTTDSGMRGVYARARSAEPPWRYGPGGTSGKCSPRALAKNAAISPRVTFWSGQ